MQQHHAHPAETPAQEKPKRAILEPLAYGIEEAVAVTSIGRTTIFEAIRRGELVGRKLGKRTIILGDDLRAWLEALPRAGKAG
jgi:excisionase family DNA binding protein